MFYILHKVNFTYSYRCCFQYIQLIKAIRLAAQFLMTLILLPGCASLLSNQSPSSETRVDSTAVNENLQYKDSASNASSNQGWWHIGFHRMLEGDEEVYWYYDAFIAVKVLKPVLEKHDALRLWRFHRRAVTDNAGHRFAFFFYATRQDAVKVYNEINAHPLVTQLLKGSYIDRLSFYDIDKPIRSGVEETSDRKWPEELQKSWPYFIMGVSQTWLDLLNQYYETSKLSKDAGLDEQLDAFKQVNEKVDTLWKLNGSHAFLHHLNALFGYQELYIIERRLGRF